MIAVFFLIVFACAVVIMFQYNKIAFAGVECVKKSDNPTTTVEKPKRPEYVEKV